MWGKLIFAPFLLISIVCFSHAITISSYELFRKKDTWILSVEQKTRALRDAVYLLEPELKGKNLNSDEFLEKTHQYVEESIVLQYDGDVVRLKPINARFGGLKYEAQYAIEGLPLNPKEVTIKTSGYDDHEHSTKIFSITIGDQGYVEYFNKSKFSATFTFEGKQYEFESENSELGILRALLLIPLLGFILFVLLKRKTLFKTT